MRCHLYATNWTTIVFIIKFWLWLKSVIKDNKIKKYCVFIDKCYLSRSLYLKPKLTENKKIKHNHFDICIRCLYTRQTVLLVFLCWSWLLLKSVIRDNKTKEYCAFIVEYYLSRNLMYQKPKVFPKMLQQCFKR